MKPATRGPQGRVTESALSRFLLGAGLGVAISVPLFVGVDVVAVRLLLMSTFAAVMGTGHVLAGRRSSPSGRAALWAASAGSLVLVAGVLVLFAFR